MKEYIERDSASAFAYNCGAVYVANRLSDSNAFPAADVAKVRRGRWKISSDYGLSECSSCGWNIEEYVVDYDYCPHCGAKMECGNDG